MLPAWASLHSVLPLRKCVSKSFRTGHLERELQVVQLYRFFVSQSNKFCHHNPLCCVSTSAYFCCCLFRY